MKKETIKDAVKITLKLQPIVILYSLVSIGSKLASGHIPSWNGNIVGFVLDCFSNKRLIVILLCMFCVLFLYALIWQKCIKNIPITIMYANKSSYIFWTQIAAICIFEEKLNVCNVIGIVIIFAGIMVVNSND